MSEREHRGVPVPYPDGPCWEDLGGHIRRTVRVRRRRRVALLCGVLAACLAGLLSLRGMRGGAGGATIAGAGKDVPLAPVRQGVGGEVVLGSTFPEAAGPLEQLDVLLLQVDIDSLGVAVRQSGLYDAGVRDRHVWELCNIDPAMVFERYMELL